MMTAFILAILLLYLPLLLPMPMMDDAVVAVVVAANDVEGGYEYLGNKERVGCCLCGGGGCNMKIYWLGEAMDNYYYYCRSIDE